VRHLSHKNAVNALRAHGVFSCLWERVKRALRSPSGAVAPDGHLLNLTCWLTCSHKRRANTLRPRKLSFNLPPLPPRTSRRYCASFLGPITCRLHSRSIAA
jgi:hypothetical protein